MVDVLDTLECGHCGSLDVIEVTFGEVKRWLCQHCIDRILEWI